MRRSYDEQKQRIDRWSAVCTEKNGTLYHESNERNRMLRDHWYARYSEMANQREQKERIKTALAMRVRLLSLDITIL